MSNALERFEARDPDGLCDLLSSEAKLVIGSAVHLQPTTCERDVRRFFKWLKPYGGQAPRPVVTRVRRSAPDRAMATVRAPDGALLTARFSKEDGVWKLNGLFDATLSRIQARNTHREKGRLRAASSMSTALAAASSVSLRDGRGRSCPVVDAERFPIVTGGCLIELEGERLELSAISPFGEMAFAECDVALDVHVGADGRGWIPDMSIDGRNPCFDAAPCFSKQRRGLPWRVSIDRRGRGLQLRVDVCLDTCIGRFEGRWDLDLVRHGAGWRARADQAMIGTSGWRFDGAIEAPASRVAVRPRQPPRP